MKVLVVAGSNGVDHCQRVFAIFARLMLRIPSLQVHLVCERWQLEQITKVMKLPPSLSSRFTFVHDLLSPGVDWETNAEVFQDGRLLAWEERLLPVLDSERFHAVFSDNLAGILRYRPDTILLGNFLWSDVFEAAFPEDTTVQEFVRRERDLLRKVRPFLLCSSEFTMPAMLHKTQAIRCGLMVDHFMPKLRDTVPGQRLSVAILSARDVVDDDVLADISHSIAKRADWDVYVEQAVYDAMETKLDCIKVFGGLPQDYTNLDAVIAPPQFSILNECLVIGIPLLAYYPPKHIEKAHLAAKLQQLKLGGDLGSAISVMPVIDAVRNLTSERAQKDYAVARQKVNANGYDEAVTWIEKRLNS